MYPPYPRYPSPPPRPKLESALEFIIGLMLGLIPGIFDIIAIGASPSSSSCNPRYNTGGCYTPPVPAIVSILSSVCFPLWLVVLVVSLVLISFDRPRLIGLGMVTAWFVDLVIPFIGCLVVVPG